MPQRVHEGREAGVADGMPGLAQAGGDGVAGD